MCVRGSVLKEDEQHIVRSDNVLDCIFGFNQEAILRIEAQFEVLLSNCGGQRAMFGGADKNMLSKVMKGTRTVKREYQVQSITLGRDEDNLVRSHGCTGLTEDQARCWKVGRREKKSRKMD